MDGVSCDVCDGSFRDKDNDCQCIAKYVENGAGECEACHYSCKSCLVSLTFDSCDSCETSDFRLFVGNTCICDIENGYYDDGSSP